MIEDAIAKWSPGTETHDSDTRYNGQFINHNREVVEIGGPLHDSHGVTFCERDHWHLLQLDSALTLGNVSQAATGEDMHQTFELPGTVPVSDFGHSEEVRYVLIGGRDEPQPLRPGFPASPFVRHVDDYMFG